MVLGPVMAWRSAAAAVWHPAASTTSSLYASAAFWPALLSNLCHGVRQCSSQATDTRSLTDLRHPASWYVLHRYPGARALHRTIICHLGPTNSGKTHAALQALKRAETGLYCGPLRLLACEVFDRLNASGVACDLLTGQEVKRVEGAQHTACTVEMAAVGSEATGQIYQVAVLDEIQMIGDSCRGWAWTRALLGLSAHQVHVCGDPGALPLLQKLARDAGDTLRVCYYSRLSSLVVSGQALGSLSQVKPGDALVAFSRRAVHGLQREVVRRAPWATTSLVYGALPPDARRHQAAVFNQGQSGFDVLLSSDAIGMGLNLAVQRVVFTSMSKWDGTQVRTLLPAEVRQIAGRAGRYGVIQQQQQGDTVSEVSSSHIHQQPSQRQQPSPDDSSSPQSPQWSQGSVTNQESAAGCATTSAAADLNISDLKDMVLGQAGPAGSGFVTCLHDSDLPLLHAAMQSAPAPITAASLLPRSCDLALYHDIKCQDQDGDSLPLDQVIRMYMQDARLSSHYQLGDMTSMLQIAGLLSGSLSSELSVSEQLVFCMAPADVTITPVAAALLRFVALFVEEGEVPLSAARLNISGSRVPTTEVELRHLEEAHAVLDLYVWLAFRLPLAFRDLASAQAERSSLASLITQGLSRLAVYHHQRTAARQAALEAAGSNQHRHHHAQRRAQGHPVYDDDDEHSSHSRPHKSSRRKPGQADLDEWGQDGPPRHARRSRDSQAARDVEPDGRGVADGRHRKRRAVRGRY